MIQPNALYLADCIDLLSRIDSQMVDLIYIDPPPMTNYDRKNGNFLYQHLNLISRLMQQSYRILKNNGNMFFYCRPNLGDTYRFIINQIFFDQFVDEYIIPLKNYNNSMMSINNHNVVLHYSRTRNYTFNKQKRILSEDETKYYTYNDQGRRFLIRSLISPTNNSSRQFEWRGIIPRSGQSWKYNLSEIERLDKEDRIFYNKKSMPFLKNYLDEHPGIEIGSIWNDIQILPSKKNNNYEEQQSLALLERIIKIGSNLGDIVLDPFCGSGTSLIAAHNNGRKWIGCDIDSNAISVAIERLYTEASTTSSIDYKLENSNDIKKYVKIYDYYEYIPLTLSEISNSNVNKELENINNVMNIIKNGENENTEFKVAAFWDEYNGKVNDKMIERIIISIAGFINSPNGGNILIGVSDNGEVIGLEKDFNANKQKNNKDGYELWIRDKINANLGKDFSVNYRMNFYEIEGKIICYIKVDPSNNITYYNDEIYIRNGNQTVKLSTREALQYIKQRDI